MRVFKTIVLIALLLVFGYWFAILYICAYAVKNQKLR